MSLESFTQHTMFTDYMHGKVPVMEKPTTKYLTFLVKQEASIQKRAQRCTSSPPIFSNVSGIAHLHSSNSEVNVQHWKSSSRDHEQLSLVGTLEVG